MAKLSVGLQLYSVRDNCKADFYGTLESVAKMGYDGVEFAGFYDKPATELRKVIDDLGLQVAGSHTGWGLVEDPEKRKETLAYNLTLGNRYMVVPGLPQPMREDAAALRDTAKRFEELAAELGEAGVRTGYHNHWWEFEPVDGSNAWEIIFDNTPTSFIHQLDIGHAVRGGADVEALIHKYAGRSTTVHVKDYSRENGYVLVGEGDVNWPSVLATCADAGETQWYIIEQEEYPYGPMETVERCLKNLRSISEQ